MLKVSISRNECRRVPGKRKSNPDSPDGLDTHDIHREPLMRRACTVSLIAPLILTACGDGGPAPERPVDPPPMAPPVQAPPATPDRPSPDRIRTDILAALAAHSAGLEVDSPAGSGVLDHFPPADCLAAADVDGMPFERICAWRAQPGADQGADISLIIEDGLILGAVVRDRPRGVEDWDCQPAIAPPNHTICMATRVSSAQSGAWNDYWTALTRG